MKFDFPYIAQARKHRLSVKNVSLQFERRVDVHETSLEIVRFLQGSEVKRSKEEYDPLFTSYLNHQLGETSSIVVTCNKQQVEDSFQFYRPSYKHPKMICFFEWCVRKGEASFQEFQEEYFDLFGKNGGAWTSEDRLFQQQISPHIQTYIENLPKYRLRYATGLLKTSLSN